MSNFASEPESVLVTGGSGFLASWIIVTLLRQGFTVRTTVRNPAREAEVRAMLAEQLHFPHRLSFHAADLLSDAGWAEATAGAAYVIHPASPMAVGEFKDQDIVAPAREGTRRVLEAATQAGARRVVVTSSGVAALPPLGTTSPLHETLWTERPDTPAFQYARAKTLAERDAWTFVASNTDAPELVTILPGFIQGPVMGADYSASVGLVAGMLRGKAPVVPRVGFGVVDVRDLAELHVLAMLAPDAAGERFLAVGEFLWLIEFADVLRARFGERAAKAPARVLPDWLVRALALVSKDMASLAPDLGVRRTADSSKAQRLLGWTTRPAADSLADAAASLIERGLV